MTKEGKIFRKADIPVLNQLIQSLEEAVGKLENSYGRNDYEGFNKAKKFIIDIQRKIGGMIK